METTASPVIGILLYISSFFSEPVVADHPVIDKTTQLPVLTFQLVKEEKICTGKTITDLKTKKNICLDNEILLSDIDIKKVSLSRNPYGRHIVLLVLTRRGAEKFAVITEKNKHSKLAIIFNGKILSAPIIREKISGGRLQISGSFTIEEAQKIAASIDAAAKFARK